MEEVKAGFKGKIPQEIFEALADNRCILFVGAGLSQGVIRSDTRGLPNWKGLLSEMACWLEAKRSDPHKKTVIEDIKKTIAKDKLVQAGQALQNEMKKSEMAEFLDSVFRDVAVHPSKAHLLLPQIRFKAILTTNYDKLIEMAFHKDDQDIPVFTHAEISSHMKKDRFIFKVHGDIDRPDTIILGSKGYNELRFLSPEYIKFLENLFTNNVVVFVGYSGNDPDITLILEKLSTIFENNSWTHYMLQPAGENTDTEKNDLRDKGLEVLEYKTDEGHTQVAEFLNALIPANFNPAQKSLITQKIEQDISIEDRLRAGSKDYFNRLRNEDGRFRHINICSLILPEVEKQLIKATVEIEDKPFSLNNSLQSLWLNKCKHAVIIGEGGMGKTVSVLQLWEQYLSEKCPQNPVPIFLALNEYNEHDVESPEKYIVKKIGQEYLGKEHLSTDEENQIWGFFRNSVTQGQTYIPSAILLLDGFNEVTVDKNKLLVEISGLIRRARGLQLVITSRYDMRGKFNWIDFNKLQLKELNQEQIETYLETMNPRLQRKLDKRQLKLLGNPMMLTVYAASCELIDKQIKNTDHFMFKKNPETIGETLWNFAESLLAKEYEQNSGISPKNFAYYKLILKHLLPYIGYRMERTGKFYLDDSVLEAVIVDGCILLRSESFYHTFPEYREYRSAFDYSNIQRFKSSICSKLSLMVKEQRSYRFLHQHFRDYFSAIHILNMLEMAIWQGQLPEILSERALPVYIRRLVGEIQEEHRKRPQLNERGWFMPEVNGEGIGKLDEVLDICRGKFDEYTGLVVWNVIEIWKNVRGELTGANLASLNLSKVGFNNVRCSRWYKDKYFSAMFTDALFAEKNIFPQGHREGVNSAVYSEDGKKILSCSNDGTVKEWEVEIGECLQTYVGHEDRVTSAIYSEDGKKILSCSNDGTVKEWEVETGKCLQTYAGHKYYWVRSAIYSEDGKKILSCSNDGTVKEWEVETGECLQTYAGHKGWVRAIYSEDGKKILSCSNDRTIKEWGVETGECLQTYAGHESGVNSASYSGDGKKILSCSWDTIKEWEIEAGECLQTYAGHESKVNSAIYSEDGKKILSCSADGTVKEWEVEIGECLQTYVGHEEWVRSAIYSEDGKKILSCSDDGTVKEWEVESVECPQTYVGHESGVNSAIYSEDGKKILSCSADGTVKEWEVEIGECLQTYAGHESGVNSAIYSEDVKKILSCSDDGTVKEWEVETGECLQTYAGHESGVDSAIYSEDGKKILSCSNYGTVKEWEIKTGECLQTYAGHKGWVRAIYSEDGKKILSYSLDGTVKEWKIETGKCLQTYAGHERGVNSAIYSEDGTKILSCSNDGTVKEWEVGTGECLQTYARHKGLVRAIYSEDGKKILSYSYDGIVKEWEVETGECLHTYTRHGSGVHRAICIEEKILSFSADGTVEEWDEETGKCLQTLINIPGLLLQGCDLRNLRLGSEFSEESKKLLHMYKVRI